jgi:hypothetical protein
MTEPTLPASALEARIRIASLLVIAMSGFVVMLGIVGSLVLAGVASRPNPTVTVAIVSAAFFALIGSVLYRRFNYQPIRLRQVHANSEELGLAAHMLRTTIVSAALAEVVAVFGFLVGMLTGDTYYLYALCAIALIGVLSNFPRARRWRELSTEIATHAASGVSSGSFRTDGAG